MPHYVRMHTAKLLISIALIALMVLTGVSFAFAELMPDSLEPSSGGESSQIFVDKQGNALIENAKVIQVAGQSFFLRVTWGQSFVRLLLRTNDSTKITRLDGTPISYADIKVGDVLNMKGRLDSATDSLSITAATVKNVSLKQRVKAYAGTVSAMAATSTGFVLTQSDKKTVTVLTANAVVTKGTRGITAADIFVGDKITTATGVYDPSTDTLTANKVVVYIDMNRFKEQNFQGTLVEAPDAAAGTLRLRIKDATYTVQIAKEAKVLDKKSRTASLARFIAGDTVRVYGALQEADTSLIKASVVRNTDL